MIVVGAVSVPILEPRKSRQTVNPVSPIEWHADWELILDCNSWPKVLLNMTSVAEWDVLPKGSKVFDGRLCSRELE